MTPEKFFSYFPELTSRQQEQFMLAAEAYREWNQKINVISRKDMDELFAHHFAHSLFITKHFQFPAGTKLMDVGTGGGFPGVPLAIFFPESEFLLVDSIGKKLRVIEEVCREAGIQNVTTKHSRIEDIKVKVDVVTGRAVTTLGTFWNWVRPSLIPATQRKGPGGLLYLKGGDLTEELKEIPHKTSVYPMQSVFSESFFETKALVHVAY